MRRYSSIDTARKHIERAIAIERAQLGDQHPSLATSLHVCALICFSQGEYRHARQCEEEALGILDQYPDEYGQQRRDYTIALGQLCQATGSPDIALVHFQWVLEVDMVSSAPDWSVYQYASMMGKAAMDVQNYELARECFERERSIAMRLFGPTSAQSASASNNLGGILLMMGNRAMARMHFEYAGRICREKLSHDDPVAAAVRYHLSLLGDS